MKPLLLVMNPRNIPQCVAALESLNIDKVWLKNYTEAQLQSVIPSVLAECDHDPIGILSDDALPTQRVLESILEAYEPSAVYTGYCNIDSTTSAVNLSTQPMIIQREATPACYTTPTRDDIDNAPTPLVRSWFAGFGMTFMSRALWDAYPFSALGDPGVQSDYQLCCRLQEDGVPIWAVRGAWFEHLKGGDLTTNAVEGGALRVGIEAASVVWQTA